MKKLVYLLAVAIISTALQAGVIATVDSYNVGKGTSSPIKTWGYPVTTSNNWSDYWTTHEAVSSAALGISAGLSVPGTPAETQFSAVGWNVAGRYFSLTVDLADDYEFGDDVELKYGGLRRSGTGPKNAAATIIVDGGAESTLRSITVTESYQNFVEDLSEILEGANSVEIRFYASDATSAAGTFRIGNHYLNSTYSDMGLYGSIVSVPEPATLLLLGLGFLATRKMK